MGMGAETPGKLLGGIATGVKKIGAAWKDLGVVLKLLFILVILALVGRLAVVPIVDALTRKKIGTTINGPVVNGPVVGQIGDHNKQDLTLVNTRSGYLAPKIVSSEHHVGYVGDSGEFEDAWVTRVVFDLLPGIWDQSMPTELKLHFNGPYDHAGFPEGFGVLMMGVQLMYGEWAARGMYLLGTTTAPYGNVAIEFRSKQPLLILEWEVHPPGRPSEYRPGP